jgi:hypothetical protein
MHLSAHLKEAAMMSVHDALEAWQAGELTSKQAMDLTGAGNVVELYGMAQDCDVDIRVELSPAERASVEAVSGAIDRVFAQQDTVHRSKIA